MSTARQPCYALDEEFCVVVEAFARYGDLAPGMLELLRELANVNEARRNDVDYRLDHAKWLLRALE